MTKTEVMRLLFAAAIVVFAAPSASAQNAASNKAVFAYNPDGVSVSSFFDRVELFSLPSIIKTSSNGSLLLGLSMECSLYTYNSVTSTGWRLQEFIKRSGDCQSMGVCRWSAGNT